MEASAAARAAHAEHPPPAHLSTRMNLQVLGILLFIISEVMLFGSFFTALFFDRVVANTGPWPPNGFELPVRVAAVNTLILLSSSFTMHYALRSIRNEDRRGMKIGLVVTFLLGATFLASQIREYFSAGFAIHDGAFGSTFYGLTGLHGAHVLVGLTLLAFATTRAFRGHFSKRAHLGVEVPGIYWHFVDIMWIIVFTAVYVF